LTPSRPENKPAGNERYFAGMKRNETAAQNPKCLVERRVRFPAAPQEKKQVRDTIPDLLRFTSTSHQHCQCSRPRGTGNLRSIRDVKSCRYEPNAGPNDDVSKPLYGKHIQRVTLAAALLSRACITKHGQRPHRTHPAQCGTGWRSGQANPIRPTRPYPRTAYVRSNWGLTPF
jgi:hypothetical protein